MKGHIEGSLYRQLGISLDDKIPMSMLKKIKSSEIGKVVKNPSRKGKDKIKVTRLLKKRAVLAITLKKVNKKSYV